MTRWLPPVVLMGVIFLLSAQPSLDSGLGGWDMLLRKGAHMFEFGLLWFLLWRALRFDVERGGAVAACALALLYAASDEWHQSFVSGRHGTPVDVAIDAAGIGLAMALGLWWRVRSRRRSGAPDHPSRPRAGGEREALSGRAS